MSAAATKLTRGPPVAICQRCQCKIIFDDYIRNPQGVCIPLNPDYSRHLCYDKNITKNEVDKQAINYLEFITSKINKGLYLHKVRLVIEETAIPGEMIESRPSIAAKKIRFDF